MPSFKLFTDEIRLYLSNRTFVWSTFISFLLFAVSLVINFFAMAYASASVSNPVTDIVLSNTPVVNVDAIFIWGPVFLTALVTYLLLRHPRHIPFTMKSIALFVLIRSVFITLTHIAPFPVHTVFSTAGIVGYLTSVNDLFFSGHTGMPFLLALIFWDILWLRITLICISIFFGVTVLAGHLHYSIDVLAAFFITYTIYHMAVYLFPRDREMFTVGPALP